MQKKNTVQTACEKVEGFKDFHQKIKRKMSLMGKSRSTFENYAHHLALSALHFNCVPIYAEAEEVNAYLYLLQQTVQSPSQSYFKFAVYSLRFAYRMENMPEKYIQLPTIRREKKLPVVLSREEMRRMLVTPKLLKHRLVIALLYGCGLRCFEVRNVQLPDLDLDRKMLHVRQGKGKKDRYVPLSDLHVEWIQQYVADENPDLWLFDGRSKSQSRSDVLTPYSPKGLGWVIRQTAKNAGIIKRISTHSLRHTFATHLLEDGLDIVSIKDLLGHANIATTMVYLHIAHYDRVKSFSPLDTLYNPRRMHFHQSSGMCGLVNHILECDDCRKSGLYDVIEPRNQIEAHS